MIPANGTVVDHNVPCPERDSIPLENCQEKPSSQASVVYTFLTSNRFFPSFASPSAPFFLGTTAEVGASVISTSAMVTVVWFFWMDNMDAVDCRLAQKTGGSWLREPRDGCCLGV